MLIEQFIPLLQNLTASHYVLVGDEGEILGLLDSPRLFQTLTAALIERGEAEQRKPDQNTRLREQQTNQTEAKPQKTTKRQQRQNAQLVQQLLAQNAELEMQVKSQQKTINQLRTNQETFQAIGAVIDPHFPTSSGSAFTEPLHPLLLNPLLELLERLPLPLMLQTSSGQVLAQNTDWRDQVGELLDPSWLRQEAAPFLEMPDDEAPGSIKSQQQSWMSTHEGSLPSGSLCHLGPKPGTCICVCPLKNGQQQVLQFVKIPIGLLSTKSEPDLNLPTADTNSLPSQRWQSAPNQDSPQIFRLATLLDTPSSPGSQEAATHTLESEPTPLIGRVSIPAAFPAPSEMLWLVFAQDMTEQQQLARELTAKNADLIQLNRLKDEFLACISHELRTPLTAVLGLSSLLKDQTIGEMNQRQMRYAQLIYQSGRHLMAVVNDILDLTRMETGQLSLISEPVDIPTVCNRAFDQAKQLRLLDDRQPMDGETALLPHFELEIESGLSMVVADEQRLRQMLVHLLVNALKFTEPEKQTGLKVCRWGGWIAFTVWDQGIGVPADKQHLIFQKFQQLENPLTRRFEGTGLGLVLTQRLARLHGGDVTFISKEGEGSQFTVLLPPSPPHSPTLLTNRDQASSFSEYPGGAYR